MTSTPTTTPDNSAYCASCGAKLAGGARFCHRCGTTVVGAEAAPRAPGVASRLPWAVAGLALLALIALIVGQSIGGGNAGNAAGAPLGAAPVPDISSMSPQEQADRLFNRVMQLSSDGKLDSARFFAPMAMNAIAALTPATPHSRYDLGLVALVAAETAIAAAQADTILRESPKHLLGLILAARAAEARRDDAGRRAFEKRLLDAEAAESARGLPEYIDHANDITTALAAARRTGR